MARQWTLETPPVWKTDAVATERGWEHPDTGELLIAIGGLASLGDSANIIGVTFSAASYTRGSGNITVTVQFNEKVDTSNGATIVITKSTGGTLTGTASAQPDDNTVEFTVASPALETILSIGAQTVSGTIVDDAGAVKASKVLTVTDNPANNETVVLDGKTYTFKSTLTNSNGNVKIGDTKEDSLRNLAAAITLGTNPVTGAGAGTAYANATTLHSTVTATSLDDELTVTAKTAGTAGNSLAISETLTNGAFAGGATTLSGGAVGATSTKTISAPVGTACGTAKVTTAAVISAVAFDSADYADGATVTLTATFSVAVDASAGATLVVDFAGTDPEDDETLVATAVEQLNDTTIAFTCTAPAVEGELSIAAQTISGTILNDVTGTVANKAISGGVATTCGTSTVTPA